VVIFYLAIRAVTGHGFHINDILTAASSPGMTTDEAASSRRAVEIAKMIDEKDEDQKAKKEGQQNETDANNNCYKW
jgi:hypothetical protein